VYTVRFVFRSKGLDRRTPYSLLRLQSPIPRRRAEGWWRICVSNQSNLTVAQPSDDEARKDDGGRRGHGTSSQTNQTAASSVVVVVASRGIRENRVVRVYRAPTTTSLTNRPHPFLAVSPSIDRNNAQRDDLSHSFSFLAFTFLFGSKSSRQVHKQVNKQTKMDHWEW
jgi:hypothetical protein